MISHQLVGIRGLLMDVAGQAVPAWSVASTVASPCFSTRGSRDELRFLKLSTCFPTQHAPEHRLGARGMPVQKLTSSMSHHQSTSTSRRHWLFLNLLWQHTASFIHVVPSAFLRIMSVSRVSSLSTCCREKWCSDLLTYRQSRQQLASGHRPLPFMLSWQHGSRYFIICRHWLRLWWLQYFQQSYGQHGHLFAR